MGYHLGVDLGTTFTAAAVMSDGQPTMLGLGNRALQIPSVLYFHPDGAVLVGEAAELRSGSDPAGTVREFKRRIGDPVPILVAGRPYSAQALSGRLLRWVLDKATEQLGEAPVDVTLTYPANWAHFKIDLLRQVAALADIDNVLACSEPEAAALQYASRTKVNAGDRIAVYDLGGGTFDICVLEKTDHGFAILGRPEGIEHLGGIDFDEAVFRRVIDQLPPQDLNSVSDDPDDAAMSWLSRLRRDCVEAKEALSTDVEAVIPVALPGSRTSVRLTRGELEDIIRPPLEETIGAVRRALRSAETEPTQLTAMVLVGGSSRIPLVAEMLGNAFRCPIAVDTHPKNDVAMGAARAATLPDAARSLIAPTGHRGSGPGTGRQPRHAQPTGTGPFPGAPQPSGAGPSAATGTGPGMAPFDARQSGPGSSPTTAGYSATAGPELSSSTATGPSPTSRTGPFRPAGPGPFPQPGQVPGSASGPDSGRVQGQGPGPRPWPGPGPWAGSAPAGTPNDEWGSGRPRDPRSVDVTALSSPGASPGTPRADTDRRRRLMVLAAAAVAVVIAGTVTVVALRSGGDNVSATGSTVTAASSSAGSGSSSLVAPSSQTPQLISSAAAASAQATVSALGLPTSSPLSDKQLIVPGVVSGNADLFLVDVAANKVTARLTTDPADDRTPALSPDRSSIIYGQQTDTTRTLRVMAANGGGDRALFASPPAGCARTNRPAWNPVRPDSLALVCIDGAGKYSLQLVTLDGQVERVLDTGLARFDDVSFSPDGSKLSFWGSEPSNFEGGSIYVMAADGSGPAQQVTKEKAGTDADPMWSPDGSEIAFRRRMPSSSPRGNLDIFVMKAGGEGVRQLTTDPAMDQNPSWSPDGLEIAFSSQPDDDAGENHLWVVFKDGVRELVPTQVVSDDGAAAWSRR